MKQPEIRINFSDLLYNFASADFAKSMGEELPSYNQCQTWTANYRTEWSKYEVQIVHAITDVVGVSFYKPVIDVSVAPFFIPQSDPLIMNFRNNPDQFVDVLTHELLHVLLTDNNKVRIRDEIPALNLVDEWQQMFGKEHDFNTLVHIPVQALMKYMYMDVLMDTSRYERDVEESVGLIGSEAYVKSWEYVNSNNYHEIIGKLRAMYATA